MTSEGGVVSQEAAEPRATLPPATPGQAIRQ